MDDLATQKYKSQLSQVVQRWDDKLRDLGATLAPVELELAGLLAVSDPDAVQRARIVELTAERNRIRARIEMGSLELRLDTMAISPAPDSGKSAMKGVAAWLKGLLKKAEISLGNGVTLSPQVKFDLAHLKLTYLGVKIRW